MEKIYTLYNQGDYAQTIQLINKLDKAQRNEETDFILANAYQAVNNYGEAIVMYEKIANSESLYARGAKWYMALCYLSLEKPNEARAILEKLQNTKSSYAEKAKELLEEIK
jgi:tetratricopeptide (TPR) repeat protein